MVQSTSAAVAPGKRVYLVGYSFGVISSYEMARQMTSAPPARVILVDMQVSWPYLPWGRGWVGALEEALITACRKFAGDSWTDELWSALLASSAGDDNELRNLAATHYMPSSMRRRDWDSMINEWTANVEYLNEIAAGYDPSGGCSTCPIALVRSSSAEFERCVANNRAVIGDALPCLSTSGNHFSLMDTQHVANTVRVLQDAATVAAVCHPAAGGAGAAAGTPGSPRPGFGADAAVNDVNVAAAKIVADTQKLEASSIEEDASASSKLMCFLFTGQGSQYKDMGKALYETETLFRDTIDHCDLVLRDILPRRLIDVLYDSNTPATVINDTVYTQPAIFAVEYALARLWLSKVGVTQVKLTDLG